MFDRIEFEGRVPKYMQTFMSAYHSMLKRRPTMNTAMLDGQAKALTVKPNSKVLEQATQLRRTLMNEGIVGFSKENPKDVEIFLNNYVDYSIHKTLKNTTRRDGQPINDNDMAQLQYLMEKGLVGRNFEMPAITGVIDAIKARSKSGKLELDGKKLDLDNDAVLSMFESKGAKERNLTSKELVELYNELIEPFRLDDKGNGLLKTSKRTIAQVEYSELLNWVESLRTLKVANNRASHKDLLDTFEMLSKNTSFDKESRASLDYIYRNLQNPDANISALIQNLAKRGVYDTYEKKLTVEPGDKTLIEQLRKITREDGFDFSLAKSDNEVSNKI